MSEEMWVELVIGPVTTRQEQLSELLAGEFPEYRLEPGPIDGRMHRYTVGLVNHGIDELGAGNGRLTRLIEAKIPYRIRDDGGSIHDGLEVLWHPAFDDDVLTRQVSKEGEVIIPATLVNSLAEMDDTAFARVIRGLVKDSPADPELIAAHQLLSERR